MSRTLLEDGPISRIGFYREYDVLAIVPVSRNTWWTGIRTGKYPRPYKLSGRAVGWRKSDIHDLVARIEAEGRQ